LHLNCLSAAALAVPKPKRSGSLIEVTAFLLNPRCPINSSAAYWRYCQFCQLLSGPKPHINMALKGRTPGGRGRALCVSK
jgi:hypothetical protein